MVRPLCSPIFFLIPVLPAMSETMTAEANLAEGAATTAADQPPQLTMDGRSYLFEALSERARMLSLDYVRTDQEWAELLHRYRQFVAMETTVVNHLKDEVQKADLQPVEINGEPAASERPLLTIDSTSYDATTIPDTVRLYVEDLVRNSQERQQLEFRLRQLDAARTTYLSEIRAELETSGAQPIDNPSAPA